MDSFGWRCGDAGCRFSPAGHGVVHGSAGALPGPVLSGHVELVAIRQDKCQAVAAGPSDTGAYCKARRRLSADLLPGLALRTAAELSAQAGPEHLWHGHRVLAVDGSAFSMPDTAENQAKYPQPSSQKKGCGFPVAGFVAVICLATGALLGAMLGTWKAHELTLFFYLRRHFRAGDIFLADRGFSSYAEVALFWKRGVDSVLRLHQRRRTDFRSGRVLGVDDHVATWIKPVRCPKGLSREDYEQLPETLQVREIRYRVMVKGYRTSEVVLTTTLLDAEKYSAEALADLYFQRWQVEVDFRHIKITMQLDVCRGKSP
ncbi:MAG: IS4 family transposase, partial [Planctomycetota bacterium]|nr:IS4 family transposase [Planctomycetota bacterium]